MRLVGVEPIKDQPEHPPFVVQERGRESMRFGLSGVDEGMDAMDHESHFCDQLRS